MQLRNVWTSNVSEVRWGKPEVLSFHIRILKISVHTAHRKGRMHIVQTCTSAPIFTRCQWDAMQWGHWCLQCIGFSLLAGKVSMIILILNFPLMQSLELVHWETFNIHKGRRLDPGKFRSALESRCGSKAEKAENDHQISFIVLHHRKLLCCQATVIHNGESSKLLFWNKIESFR